MRTLRASNRRGCVQLSDRAAVWRPLEGAGGAPSADAGRNTRGVALQDPPGRPSDPSGHVVALNWQDAGWA